jgi:Pentapeptide repeats (8 copies)
VQLGGIYALQQIGRSSPEERGAIYEILAAYVRVHSPWADRHDAGPVNVEAIPRLREHQPGVQAAMLALGRRVAEPSAVPLALMGTDLRRLRLSDTYIPGGANLENALFWRSSLINAGLGKANLRGAKLGWTDLRYSFLESTDLRGADLRRADLRYAKLRDVDLRGADLRGSDLREIENLNRANLVDAKVNDETKWPDAFDLQAARVITTSG